VKVAAVEAFSLHERFTIVELTGDEGIEG